MNDPIHPEEAIFEAAFALPASERAAYLDRTCGGNAGLRQLVEALLKADEEAGEFLESPAPGAEPSPAADPQTPRAVSETTPSIEKPGDRIGRYKLLQQIGEGGCGVVYMAEQETPVRRKVALKVIKLGMDTKQVIARFEAERQALALMDHPNIAKVLDASATENGRPYFVMELVHGIKITDYCDQNQLPTRQRLHLFVQVCQAIQHAHQKGIIHRDIKPSNILVTLRDGVPVPKVIDFGIAKATTDQRLTDKTLFTAFQQFIGTPAYMSPEQAEMSELGIDTRCDIYSLGVLLYELLTGQTPFDAKERLQAGLDAMRRIICEQEPARPSTRLGTLLEAEQTSVANHRQTDAPKLVNLLRGDLDWIVIKSLEKDRARRYETANGLAMDVQRHLNDEPVVARPPSNWYRFQKLVRRNKLAFLAALAVVAALVVGLGLSAWQFVEKSRAEREQNRLREQAEKAQTSEARLRQLAQTQELAARRKAYASDMNLVRQALEVNHLARAQDLLYRHRPTANQQDVRGWEWRYWWSLCQSEAAFTLSQGFMTIYSIAFSRDGSLLAVGAGGEVTVWELATRQVIFHHREPSESYQSDLAFSLTDDLLAFRAGLGSFAIWNSHDRKEVRRLRTGGFPYFFKFVSEGRLVTVASGPKTNNVTMWDVNNGIALSNLAAPFRGYAFDVTADGQRIARSPGDQRSIMQVRDLAEDTSAWSVQASKDLVSAIAFSPDGGLVATGPQWLESAITIWSVQTHQPVAKLNGHLGWIGCLRFLPDGKTLISGSGDQTLRLWDVPSGRVLRTLWGHLSEVWTLAVSPDGRKVASGGRDGEVLCWDLPPSKSRPPPFQKLHAATPLLCWRFSPNGRFIVAAQDDRVNIYDATTLQLASEPSMALTNIGSVAFSSDTRFLAATDASGRLAVWDLLNQRVLTNFIAHPAGALLFGSGFLPADKSLLTVGSDQMAREWDAVTWRQLRSWPMPEGPDWSRALCPLTGLAAAANSVGGLELIPTKDPGARRQMSGEPYVDDLTFSPDGKILATSGGHAMLELWDTENGKLTASLRSVSHTLYSVAISHDGRRLAAGCGLPVSDITASGATNRTDGITVWDLQSLEEVATLEGEGSPLDHVAFSPDGGTLAALSHNGILYLWRAPSWGEIAAQEKKR
jgi:serine/threonine protein kinase/WD40 repeat protein